jgi:hypothetical protein
MVVPLASIVVYANGPNKLKKEAILKDKIIFKRYINDPNENKQ